MKKFKRIIAALTSLVSVVSLYGVFRFQRQHQQDMIRMHMSFILPLIHILNYYMGLLIFILIVTVFIYGQKTEA